MAYRQAVVTVRRIVDYTGSTRAALAAIDHRREEDYTNIEPVDNYKEGFELTMEGSNKL
jgi:hypothetical protein